jgi:hypothetical protein
MAGMETTSLRLAPDTNSTIAARLAAIPNPFARDVVGSPLEEMKADVPRINKTAYEHCVKLIERVRTQRESGSLVLYGDPGTGKTHLLSRLRTHIEQTNTVLIPMRMQTSPGMIWRFVRARVVEALLRRQQTLDQLLEHRESQLQQMAHRDLALVLGNLLQGRHVRDSRAWLAGEDLPESVLLELRLSTQPVDEEYQEERAYQIVKELAQLAEPVPLVFCLDQVEALQRHTNDQEGIFALGKLVSVLYDELHNAAIICCVQTTFLDDIKRSIRDAEQDRMLRNKANLLPLTYNQALDMIEARLVTQPAIHELRPKGLDRLWPIDSEKLKPIFAPGNACVARRVLHRCRELYDEASQVAVTSAEPVDAYLGRLYEERYRVPNPQETDFILRDALPQIFQILGLQPRGFGGAPRSGAFDLVVEHEGRPAAFALCNQRPGIGLVNRFRKLGEKWDKASMPRLILLRDARLGISPNAKTTFQRLDELRERKAQLVNVSPEALAALDALRGLLADADAGDLSHNGESVSRKRLEEWIANHLPDPVADLIDEMRGARPGSAPAIFPLLTEFLNEHKIVSTEDAARELKIGIKEVVECARQNPQQFGIIDGHRPVLFQPVRSISG